MKLDEIFEHVRKPSGKVWKKRGSKIECHIERDDTHIAPRKTLAVRKNTNG